MSSVISDQEREWALAVKTAHAESDPEHAKSMTDFEYLQHGIIAKEKVKKALKRINRLKAFQEEYKIPLGPSIVQDPEAYVKEAMASFRELNKRAPECMISFGREEKAEKSESDEAKPAPHVFTMSYSKFFPADFNDEEGMRVLFSSFFYLFDAGNCDLDGVRGGFAMVCPSKGLGWKNFSLEMEKRGAELYQDAYPIRITEVHMLNSSPILRAIYVLCKPFLSAHMKKVMHFDASLGKVREMHSADVLPPLLDGSQSIEGMFEALENGLKERARNMASIEL